MLIKFVSGYETQNACLKESRGSEHLTLSHASRAAGLSRARGDSVNKRTADKGTDHSIDIFVEIHASLKFFCLFENYFISDGTAGYLVFFIPH